MTHPPKNQIFQWTPKILSSSFQFEFLVMTEKNINLFINFFVIKYSDFSLFLFKITATPLKKVTSLFPKPLPIQKI